MQLAQLAFQSLEKRRLNGDKKNPTHLLPLSDMRGPAVLTCASFLYPSLHVPTPFAHGFNDHGVGEGGGGVGGTCLPNIFITLKS